MVFHLQVIAHSTRYGDLIERDSFYSNVHGTLKKAVEDGLCWLNNRIQDIYQESDYCNKKNEFAIKDMLENGEIYYSFTVTKLSPYYADNFEIPKEESKCKNLRPTHTIFNYDLDGKLKYAEIKYTKKDGNFAYTFRKYPNNKICRGDEKVESNR